MLRTLAILTATLAIGGSSAIAAEERAAPKPACHKIDELKASAPKAKFSPLNAAQFHVIEGAYLVLPPPTGLPAADGAFLAQIKGKPGMIIWTRGTCMAEIEPMQIADRFISALKMINPGQGETIDANNDEPDLKL